MANVFGVFLHLLMIEISRGRISLAQQGPSARPLSRREQDQCHVTMKELNPKMIWLLSERKISERRKGKKKKKKTLSSLSSILGNDTCPSEDGEVFLKKLPFMQEI